MNAPMPDLPSPDESDLIDDYEELVLLNEAYTYSQRLDIRVPWHEKPADAEAPVVYSWVKLADVIPGSPPFVGIAAQMIIAEGIAFLPVMYYKGFPGVHHNIFAPNLTLTLESLRPVDPNEWLLYEIKTLAAHKGMIGTSIRVWNRSGFLVSFGSSQLLCVTFNDPQSNL